MSNITFISGGVRSGKSSFAEKYLLTKTGNLVYIATAMVYDEEMRQRVARHQLSRKGLGWTTYEKTIDISDLEFDDNDIVLLDCLTNLVANEMFEHSRTKEEVISKVYQDIVAIAVRIKELVIVSNDIFSAIDDYSEDTMSYVSTLATLHNKITDLANRSYELSYRSVRERKKVTFAKEGGSMQFVFGGYHSGKKTFCLKQYPGYQLHDISKSLDIDENSIIYGFEKIILNVASNCDDPIEEVMSILRPVNNLVLIGLEVGLGVVPIKKEDRLIRDQLGFLYQQITKESTHVYRVWNGIAEKLK